MFVMKEVFTIVDELCDFSPALNSPDSFFDKMDVDIPYTANSEVYRKSNFIGSAVEMCVVIVYACHSRS